jgi:hypothetical protein
MDKKNKEIIVIIIISVVFLLLVSANILTSLSTLERGDNYFNILAAKNLIKYNLKPIGDFDLFMQKSDVVLNHPPVYVYLLAIILIIFKANWSLNFLNPILMLITGIFMMKIIKLCFKEIKSEILILLFFLFLFLPLTIQGSYLIDADVVLAFTMTLFTYFFLKNPKNILLNSFLFLLIWFAKIQGIPIIVASLFFYLIITRKTKKDYFNTGITVLLSSVLFFLMIYFYTNYFDVNFFRMFTHSSIISIAIRQLINWKTTILTSIWSFKQLLIWVIPSTFLLYILGIFNAIKEKAWIYNKNLILPLLISIITLLELIPIGTYGWNFPKYYAEFLPFMIIVITPLIMKINLSKKDWLKIGIILLIFVNLFLIIKDPYLPEVSEAFITKAYLPLIINVVSNLVLLNLPLIITFLFFIGKKDLFAKIIKILLITSIVTIISINFMQLTKPYSTNNLYGDNHENLKQTIGYLKNNTVEGDLSFLFDHVGYYFGNENNSNWYNSMLCYNSEKCMQEMVKNDQIKYLQFYSKDLERINGQVKEIIKEDFKYETNFGNYIIYKRK